MAGGAGQIEGGNETVIASVRIVQSAAVDVDRGGDVAQEEEDDQDDQAERQDEGELDVVDGLADGHRAVVERLNRDRRGQLQLSRRGPALALDVIRRARLARDFSD